MGKPPSQVFDLQETRIEGGVTVIEASAGTGKTYCLIGLVLRLLLERHVQDVSELLVVTFTQAATRELSERLRRALYELAGLLGGEAASQDPFLLHLADTHRGDADSVEIVRDALVHFDDLTVSTIHGFCHRVLAENAFESAQLFESELIENDTPVLLEAARDTWRQMIYRPSQGQKVDLIAALVVDLRWEPETFLSDYIAWSSHPNTEILPRPVAFAEALGKLEDAYEDLRRAWNLPSLELLFSTRRFRTTSYFGRGAWKKRLADADSFCRRGLNAGLRPVRELAWKRLQTSLFRRDLRGVEAHPVIAACTAFEVAMESFVHAFRGRFLHDVDRRYADLKRQTSLLSFEDLLRQLRDALDKPASGQHLAAAVRGRYRATLIDEFQDTDLIQFDIFRRLFTDGPLFLIGDPKQAIYRFRGADVFAYLSARDTAHRTYTLDRNWRTAAALVEAVNGVFAAHQRPFAFEQIRFAPISAADTEASQATLSGDQHRPLQWFWLPRLENRGARQRAIVNTIVHEILRLLAGGMSLADRPLAADDIAVLVRTNEQASEIQSALRAAGVPSVVGRSGDIFQSQEMQDLEVLLRAVADPRNGQRLRAAWATRLWGDSAFQIHELNWDDQIFTRRLERFVAYRDDWRQRGFMPMIQNLLNERQIRQRLLGFPDGPRRLTNLMHAIEVLHHAEIERRLSPSALLNWLAHEQQRSHTHSAQTELRLESDAAAVNLSTVHRSKGLEFEIVFCPYLFEARPITTPPALAHLDSENMVLDYGSAQLPRHLAMAEGERLAEDLRLTYVAMTRARHRCYVVWGDVGGPQGAAASALGYLLSPTAGSAQALTAADWVTESLARVAAGRDVWHQWLQDRVQEHRHVMELRPIDPELKPPSEAYPLTASVESLAPPRAFTGSLSAPWSFHSFSSLSRESAAELPDRHDPPTPAALRAPTQPNNETGSLSALAAFARGTRAGTCLHEILEDCDLSNLSNSADLVDEILVRHGLDDPDQHLADPNRLPASQHGEAVTFEPAVAVVEMLERLAQTTLPQTDFSLSAVSPTSKLVEWKFTTPLAQVSASSLARVFRRHARAGLRDDYAERLALLSPHEVQGFLVGFVDLIFTHDDRWYVIDWKSNDLGPSLTDYQFASLDQSMRHHHYVLQYHLYLVALHRYLEQRLEDYDYETHVAGAYYVFLRGLGGEDPTNGFYVDRPPVELIEALDHLITRGLAA